jgi:hypothetical protein
MLEGGGEVVRPYLLKEVARGQKSYVSGWSPERSTKGLRSLLFFADRVEELILVDMNVLPALAASMTLADWLLATEYRKVDVRQYTRSEPCRIPIHQMQREMIRTPKQIERPTTIMLRQDEQEHWLRTVVGLAANRQGVRQVVRRGVSRVHTELKQVSAHVLLQQFETMTPRSCEYCFGSVSWDARLVPVSSFRIGRLQYK